MPASHDRAAVGATRQSWQAPQLARFAEGPGQPAPVRRQRTAGFSGRGTCDPFPAARSAAGLTPGAEWSVDSSCPWAAGQPPTGPGRQRHPRPAGKPGASRRPPPRAPGRHARPPAGRATALAGAKPWMSLKPASACGRAALLARTAPARGGRGEPAGQTTASNSAACVIRTQNLAPGCRAGNASRRTGFSKYFPWFGAGRAGLDTIPAVA